MSNEKNERNKNTAGLFEIRDVLKNELTNFTNTANVLNIMSQKFNQIGSKYDEYGGAISESDKKIQKLKRQEFYENLFIYIGFIFYVLCVVYVFLKRFPLHRIIFAFYYLLEYIIIYFYNLKGEYFNNNEIWNNSTNNFSRNLSSIIINSTLNNTFINQEL